MLRNHCFHLIFQQLKYNPSLKAVIQDTSLKSLSPSVHTTVDIDGTTYYEKMQIQFPNADVQNKSKSCNAQLQNLATVCSVPDTPLLIVFTLVTKQIKQFHHDNLKLIIIKITVWIKLLGKKMWTEHDPQHNYILKYTKQ